MPSIFVDLDLDDLQELEAFATQVSIVQPEGMDGEIVLDAFGDEVAAELRLGRLGWVRYVEVDHHYVICVHPPSDCVDVDQKARNSAERQAQFDELVDPKAVMSLPMGIDVVRHAARKGGGRVHVGLMRLEARIHLTREMALELLQTGKVRLTGYEGLLQQPVGGYELFVPVSRPAGWVPYKRIH